jgi:hypothetical protein
MASLTVPDGGSTSCGLTSASASQERAAASRRALAELAAEGDEPATDG